MISDEGVRETIVQELSTSFAVDAGAGTGKTTLLIDRLAAVILKMGIPLPRVAAITFTEKAAGELIERLRIKLEKSLGDKTLDPNLIRQALNDLEQASVSTIHSFCASILREYPVEAGVDPRFSVLDQVLSETLELQAWEEWLKKTLDKEVDLLSRFFKVGGTFAQIESLKDQMLKNRSLLTRLPPPPLPDPGALLKEISNFHQKIPGFLRQCLDEEDPLYQQLLEFSIQWELFQRSPDPVDLAVLDLPSPRSGAEGRWEKGTLRPLKGEVKVLVEKHEDFACRVKDSILCALMDWLWNYLREYQLLKTRQGFLDFDDLLSKTRDLLKMAPLVREEMKTRYERLFVDEFQDTDPLQVEIVFLLSEERGSHAKDWQEVKLEPGKLFLVGDPQQSIYRFRRADVEIYGEAKEKLVASGGRVEKLTENFRTLSPIVEWVNGGFQKLFREGSFPYVLQKASRDGGDRSLSTLVLLEMEEVPPEEQKAEGFRKREAQRVGAYIAQLLAKDTPLIQDPKTKEKRSLRAGDIAILFRDLSNSEEVYEEALHQQGVQFSVVGGKRFYNRPEIVALETLLWALEAPADEGGVVSLLRTPLFGFSDEALFLHRQEGGDFQFLEQAPGKIGEAFSLLRDWREGIREKSPSESLLYLYERTNLLAVVAAQTHGPQRVANLLKVVHQCRDLESSQNFTYRAFVKWLTRQREEDSMEGEAPGSEETKDQVTLMTLHKAKGLEFPMVILSGSGKDAEKPKPSEFIVNRRLGSAAFKIGNQNNEIWTSLYPQRREEEKKQESAEILRLLYVGCTRARESLVLPYFIQDKAPAFLKPLWENFDLAAMAKVKVQSEKAPQTPSSPVLDLDPHQKESQPVQTLREEMSRLLKEKAQKIQSLTRVSKLKSVTSLVHSDDDKSFRESLQLEGPQMSPMGGEQQKAKAFGLLTHKLLEKGWNWNQSQLEKAALAWASTWSLPEEKAREAAQLVFKALGQEIFQRARRSARVFREVPLAGKLPTAGFLNAIVDLAFLEGDQWVLVDYKTDRELGKHQEDYHRQMDYYRQLLEHLTGYRVKETYLYFIRHQQIESVPI